jgi:cytoskeletal protein CcmA (bactofilin family)
VGGTVKIDGTATGESLSVGGSLKTIGDFSVSGRLKVGGKIVVEGDLKAQNIKVGGRIKAHRVEAEQFIETSDLRTRHGAKATRIEINRRGHVEGPLIGEIIILKDRVDAEDIYGDSVQIRSRCKVGNVYANRVHMDARSSADSITYTDELKVDSRASVRICTQKSEKLPEPPF